ncbi:hypothetical protein [Nocardioides jiangsuensis]|uniref:hypothetical protein n=1 Tax=Nocardioides jiangsuensis TaxID=2866161 RepID=UPI003557A518
MEQRLSLATWSKPEDAFLDEIETAVVRRLRPPLNLDRSGSPESDSGKPGSTWQTPRELRNLVLVRA